jgi:DHA3 family tetracycline resistance protein-like MFS transporter
MSQFKVYLVLEFCSALLFSLIFTVNSLYQVTVVQLSPLQLVLVGTILEASVFLFEIPTGVLADVKSRRLSVIIGYLLIGLGFVFEGSFAFFWTVALAQVIWGCGYTFTSGATQAWIVDEIGEERAGQAFLRGEQAARVGALAAIPFSVALGTIAIQVPIVFGGALMIGLAGFLALAMREGGFKPTPAEDRSTWGMMAKTMRDARGMMRRQPVLLVLLGIGLFYGIYSEGLDRLWVAHLLGGFALPFYESVQPVVWFGVIRGVLLVISLGAVEVARRRVDTNHTRRIARVLMVNAGLIVGALTTFALTKSLAVAVASYWLIGALRSVAAPLQTTWFNLRIDDAQVRATMFSAGGQVDAIGQVVGGPAVGAIGNVSIRAALLASSFLLAPVIPLYAAAMRHEERGVIPAPP